MIPLHRVGSRPLSPKRRLFLTPSCSELADMKGWNPVWFILGRVALIVTLVLGLGCEASLTEPPEGSGASQAGASQMGRPQVGTAAPNFTLLDLDGNWASLSDYQGRVVLLNFWATWCGPCRVEMPGMEVVYQELKSKGFEVLAISSDPQGMVVTRPFIETNGLTFPILHDSDYRVMATYGVRTLPMSFLVDRQGTIRHRVFGARDWNSPKARELIQGLLRVS